jgi:hypothetical protein
MEVLAWNQYINDQTPVPGVAYKITLCPWQNSPSLFPPTCKVDHLAQFALQNDPRL